MPKSRQKKWRRRVIGWSISLLVVVGFVGGLIPALTRAREEARRTVCKSNLKNGIGAALMTYSADWDEEFPWTEEGNPSRLLYTDYVTDLKAWQCPSSGQEVTLDAIQYDYWPSPLTAAQNWTSSLAVPLVSLALGPEPSSWRASYHPTATRPVL